MIRFREYLEERYFQADELRAIGREAMKRMNMTGKASEGSVEQVNKKTLYIHRPLLNAESLIQWAKSNECVTCLKPDAMHVTLCYSKEPMVWPAPLNNIVTVKSPPARVQQFDGGATVYHFEYEPFKARHDFLRSQGASSDFPDYKSHITLTYEGEGLNPASFTQYTGDLLFGPEVFREIDLEKKWKNSSLEEAKKFSD